MISPKVLVNHPNIIFEDGVKIGHLILPFLLLIGLLKTGRLTHLVGMYK
jgi:hypothetical protein